MFHYLMLIILDVKNIAATIPIDTHPIGPIDHPDNLCYTIPQMTDEEAVKWATEQTITIPEKFASKWFAPPLKKSYQCAPYWFVIGIFKCGTTSIYNYITKHPDVSAIDSSNPDAWTTAQIERLHQELEEEQRTKPELAKIREKWKGSEGNIYMPPLGTFRNFPNVVNVKETGFLGSFGKSFNFTPTGATAYTMNKKGITVEDVILMNPPQPLNKWMEIYFPKVWYGQKKVIGEGTPSYVLIPHVATVMKNLFPHARFIVLVREPVTRAISRLSHFMKLRCSEEKESNPSRCSKSMVLDLFDRVVDLQLPIIKECGKDMLETISTNFYTADRKIKELEKKFDSIYGKFRSCIHFKTAKIIENQRNPLNTAVERFKDDYDGLVRFVSDVLLMENLLNMQILTNSLYLPMLLNWVSRGPPASQLLLIRSEDFFHHTEETMHRVTSHLQLQPFDWGPIVDKKYNVLYKERKEKSTESRTQTLEDKHQNNEEKTMRGRIGMLAEPKIDSVHEINLSTRKKLEDFFQPWNQMLLEYLQQSDIMWFVQHNPLPKGYELWPQKEKNPLIHDEL